jgi:hypothetical protein
MAEGIKILDFAVFAQTLHVYCTFRACTLHGPACDGTLVLSGSWAFVHGVDPGDRLAVRLHADIF